MIKKKVLFIHHSTGANLISHGYLRELLKSLDPSIAFWDHSYNLYSFLPMLFAKITYHTGLTDEKREITGKDYNIVLSNNSPKEYAEIFSRDPNDHTLTSILSYDIIAFKNCYPTTKIISNEQLQESRHYYEIIRDNVKKYSKKQFIFLTPPPMRKEMTTLQNARRAQKLVEWLSSQEFLSETTNIHIFDFFSYLSDEKGFLKKEYTRLFPFDSHPNKKANKVIAPLFAKKLVEIAKNYAT